MNKKHLYLIKMATEKSDSLGFEYKSRTVLGLPLIHICYKYRSNGAPVPAKGFIAIGEFGIGVINISQFGIGLISISPFTIAGFALAQVAFAYSLIAQVGISIDQGYGQRVKSFAGLLGRFYQKTQ